MTQPASTPRPPDLSHAEAVTARWFESLPRAPAPAVLLGGGPRSPSAVLASGALSGPPRVAALRTVFGLAPALRSFAAAAAVLLALALPAQGRSGSAAGTSDGAGPATPDSQVEMSVVDDPSVPMLHALETFDQLACLTQPEGAGVR